MRKTVTVEMEKGAEPIEMELHGESGAGWALSVDGAGSAFCIPHAITIDGVRTENEVIHTLNFDAPTSD